MYQNTDQNIRVSHDASLNIVMIQFEGVIEHEDYQSAYNKLIELTKKHQCTKFIYHTKKIKKVSVRSRIWYLNHVFPAIYTPEMLISVVNAEHIGSQVATDTMRDALQEMGYGHIPFNRYNTLEEAMNWLKSVE